MAPAGSQKQVKPKSSEDATQEALAGNGAPKEGARAKSKDNNTSWYTRTWPRKPKAAAVTEVAKESISAASTIASDRLSSAGTTASALSRPLRSPSIELTKKAGGSTRSLPADAATTRINIGSVGSASVPDVPKAYGLEETNSSDATDTNDEANQNKELDSKEMREENDVGKGEPVDGVTKKEERRHRANQSSGWLGWLSRSTDEHENTPNDARPAQTESINNPKEPETQRLPPPELSNTEGATITSDQSSKTATAPSPAVKKRSWLQMWSGSASPSPQNDHVTQQEPSKDEESVSSVKQKTTNSDDSSTPQAAPAESKINDATEIAEQDRRPQDHGSSGWLFWSSRQPLSKPLEPKLDQSEPMAVDSASQNHAAGTIGVSEPKQGLSDAKSRSSDHTSQQLAGPRPGPLVDSSATPSPPPGKSKTSTPAATRKAPKIPNQLLPAVRDTFPVPDRPGIIEQIGRLLQYTKETGPKHVSLVSHPPRVKKAVAIGVHGYFPAPFIQRVIGQPTGTSVRFSTLAAQAIHEWAESHGAPCEVQKIALEGEGRIEERYDVLWKLLLNWIDDIRKADFIMVSCHSQGVPVATMIVGKLISFGCVSSARIGICAMAGVNLGPFPDYRSRWISGSAGELFDFADPESKVSQKYMDALESVLNFGVRIIYVGSIDDQLVSLESSVFSAISHPHIYRAVFVDGRVHAPSFLSHLVGFVMKLRNLGLSDHGLLRELSAPLAGSLYTGEGHSRLYEDESVYKLAVQFTLETSSVPNASLEVLKYHRSPNSNPYILPFAMRGVLEEEYVRRELAKETAELLNLFDEWKPSSKVLKDVKFRLEGIRSKL